MKDFGRNESDARKAVQLIRTLNLNEQVVIGKPTPVFEYFLTDGKPPMATVGGLELTRFNPDQLELKPHLDGWVLVEGPRPLFRFNEREQAERALGLIRQQRFDRVGHVGRPQLMTVFFSSFEGQMRPAALAAQRPQLDRPKPEIGRPARPDAMPRDPPAPNAGPKRMPFDYRQAAVRKVDGMWKVMLGTHALKAFDSERDAREALKVIQYYHFTELYTVDNARDRFEYFLVQGKAPQGRMFGQETKTFQPNQLAVQHTDGVWAIMHIRQPFFSFADEAHARMALEVIRKHHFDQVCYVGGKETGLMYFIRTR